MQRHSDTFKSSISSQILFEATVWCKLRHRPCVRFVRFPTQPSSIINWLVSLYIQLKRIRFDPIFPARIMCHKRAQQWRKLFPFLSNHTHVKHLDSILQWKEMGWKMGVWHPDRWCQSPGTSWGRRAYAHIWTGTTRSTGTNKHSRTHISQAGFITPPSVFSRQRPPNTAIYVCASCFPAGGDFELVLIQVWQNYTDLCGSNKANRIFTK